MTDVNPKFTFHDNHALIVLKDGSWWKVRRFCLTFHSGMPLTLLKDNITWKVNFGKVPFTKKRTYLSALGLADVNVGVVPSDGSHASIEQIEPFVKYMTDLMISEINQNIAFLNADARTTWWYDGETVTFRSPRTVLLLQHLKKNPKATIAELSSVLNINTSAVQKQLSNLLSKGYITKDPDSNGYLVITVSTTK